MKGEAFSAIALGLPSDGKLVVTSLAENSSNYLRQISKIELLGAKSPIRWARGREALEIQVPETPTCEYSFAFGILPEVAKTISECPLWVRIGHSTPVGPMSALRQ